ncbi:MAG TPA: hypothetical protein VNJ06_09405 [Gemmatimonadales bacterium]|nr:hypothetical protein [Gemmatimonadales bacterium]
MNQTVPMTEILAVIDAPHFYAGIVLWDDQVVEAADIVKYMRKWPRHKVRSYCTTKGWKVSVVQVQSREPRA